MATEKQIKEAKTIFESLKGFFTDVKYRYKVIAEEPERIFGLEYGVRGDNIPMDFRILIEVERGIIKLISPQPVRFPPEKRPDAAMAICALNDAIVDGSYSMDLKDGSVMYTQTTCFRGSVISSEVFRYMVGLSNSIVDAFNDKLLMLKNGTMDLDAFVKAI